MTSGRKGQTSVSMSESTAAASASEAEPLDADELRLLDAYWRAANYLSVGQIYLLDNPLLREPLDAGAREAAAARPLRHDAGPQPRLRAPEPRHPGARPRRDLRHRSRATAGPAIVANAYLEGTYSELYPAIAADEDGLRELFRQFSFPGGIPSHAAPETPGSIHEGGELGYALAHAFGAAFDNPDLARRVRRRRRRGRDRAARGELALEQVPEPAARTAPCCRSCT